MVYFVVWYPLSEVTLFVVCEMCYSHSPDEQSLWMQYRYRCSSCAHLESGEIYVRFGSILIYRSVWIYIRIHRSVMHVHYLLLFFEISDAFVAPVLELRGSSGKAEGRSTFLTLHNLSSLQSYDIQHDALSHIISRLVYLLDYLDNSLDYVSRRRKRAAVVSMMSI